MHACQFHTRRRSPSAPPRLRPARADVSLPAESTDSRPSHTPRTNDRNPKLSGRLPAYYFELLRSLVFALWSSLVISHSDFVIRPAFEFETQFSGSHNKINVESHRQRPALRHRTGRENGFRDARSGGSRQSQHFRHALRIATRALSGPGVSVFVPGWDVRFLRHGSERTRTAHLQHAGEIGRNK